MALGTRIVRELKLEPGVDTLGRWLAHHLAELILAAETTLGAERDAVQKKAIDLIMKIWSHRNEIPGRANPVKELKGVVAILRFLRPEAWPYSAFERSGTAGLLKKAFEGLQHIVAHGALLAANSATHSVNVGEAEGFIDLEEARIIETANAWVELYNSAPKNSVVRFIWDNTSDLEATKRELEELQNLAPELRARRLFTMQVDRLVETLTHLKLALGPDGNEAPLTGA